MTAINIQKVNGTTIISVAGHADYSHDHNDIVCAALSAITQSFLNALKYYEADGSCKVTVERLNEELGTANISYITSNETVTDALLTMAEIGYIMLEKSYPKNISLNIE